MKALLINPRATYILERFVHACNKNGIDLTLMLAAPSLGKFLLVDIEGGAFARVSETELSEVQLDELATHLSEYDTVVPTGEYSVIFGEQLSARMGLFHNDLAKVDSYRNKFAMRSAFAAAGVSQPKVLSRFQSMEEVDAYPWESVQFPVIVKPVEMSSSYYVRLCNDADSAKVTYRKIFLHSRSFAGASFTPHGLLEEVATGPEYSVECVVQKTVLLAAFLTTKAVSPYPACDEIGHLSGENLDGFPFATQVHTAIRQIVTAWNLTSAVLHIEFKVGTDGIVRIIEGACRIAGDMISEIVERRHGVSLEECLLLMRLRRDATSIARAPSPCQRYFYGIRYLFSSNYDDTVESDVEVISREINSKPRVLNSPGFSAAQRLGHVIARSESLTSMRAFIGADKH
jgi:predicted ATP-grasp superfamily ATP-dependent carboligase